MIISAYPCPQLVALITEQQRRIAAITIQRGIGAFADLSGYVTPE
jgi:hypothetical protein